jgi:O-succinylbenzoic acid--CoA ligase
MPKLVALELTNGRELFDHIIKIEQSGDAFCVLDPRDTPQRRELVLAALAPTHLVNSDGVYELPGSPGVSEGDGAVVITSGSSGTPKAAVLTWDALQASATMTTVALSRSGVPTWWANLTPVHIGGLAVYLRCLYSGVDPVFAASPTEALELGATHVSVVRTQLVRDDYSSFEVVLLGGGTPPSRVPANVVTTYGMTETGSGIVYDGRALSDVSLRIVDGEIHVASPTLFRGYRRGNDPTYRDDRGTRWFATGDSGELTNGTLSVFGRQAYVIVTGGEKVWPEDLESLFSDIDGVDDVAVIGRPDPEWGQRVVLVCVTERNSGEILRGAQDKAREVIGRWAAPKEIFTVAKIPRTSNGKIARHELEALVN